MNVSIADKPLPGTSRDPLYPDSDGKPMGETGFHVHVTLAVYGMLWLHFRDRQDVCVTADMFFYFEQGNPRANKSPDVMFIPGVGNHFRRSFRLWEEARGPSVIFEMVSQSSWKEDMEAKPALYARLGVTEYFVFDPEALALDPVLQGFRLDAGSYLPLPRDAEGGIVSQEMGLRIVPDDAMLVLIDFQTNQRLISPLSTPEDVEALQTRLLEQKRIAEEEYRRAEEQFLQAQLERIRREEQEQRAEEQYQQAQAEKQRAEQEKQRADALAAEVARLTALLKDHGQNQ